MITLSHEAMWKLGYKEMPEGETIEASFRSIHVYQISGINLPESEQGIFSWSLDGINIQLAIGHDINAMCKMIYGDFFTDNAG